METRAGKRTRAPLGAPKREPAKKKKKTNRPVTNTGYNGDNDELEHYMMEMMKSLTVNGKAKREWRGSRPQ